MAKKTKDTNIKSFILRIDSDMMDVLEKWATDEFRSINGQIQYLLNQAIKKAGRNSKKLQRDIKDNSNA